MASILVAHGDDDPEALFEHYRGAGHTARCGRSGGGRRGKASAVLAFDRRRRSIATRSACSRTPRPRAVAPGAGASARECRTTRRGRRGLSRRGAAGASAAADRMAAKGRRAVARRRPDRPRARDDRRRASHGGDAAAARTQAAVAVARAAARPAATGAGWSSRRRSSRTSRQRTSSASTRAGRSPPVWRWWTPFARRHSTCGSCSRRSTWAIRTAWPARSRSKRGFPRSASAPASAIGGVLGARRSDG